MPLMEQWIEKNTDGTKFINKELEDVWLYYTSILNYCPVTEFYEGTSFYIPYTIVFNLLVYQ